MLRALHVDSIEPYAGGRPFGAHGSYEWVRGRAAFAVDPDLASNARIVDLGLADRDVDGCVRFESDVRLLRPARSVGGGDRVVLVVPNRGFPGRLPFSTGAPFHFGPTEDIAAGDGFLLARGWTVAWCGWQWDVLRGDGVLGMAAPEVDVGVGWVRLEWRPDAVQPRRVLSDTASLALTTGEDGRVHRSDWSFAAYPTVELDDPLAELHVRTSPRGPDTRLPRASWRFVDHTHIELDGGFRPFHWYQLVYRTDRCPVVGAGLLAVRDLTRHLKRAGAREIIGYGVSQSARFLRQFIWEGMNRGDDGGVALDGVFCHLAGGRRGEFNHRFAQPSLAHAVGFGHLPPYDTAGLFARQRSSGVVPKAIFTNSAWEYWRGDGALLHVDAATGDDLPEDPDARSYLLTGADHFGVVPMKQGLPTTHPTQQLEAEPILRALFVALAAWVSEGRLPPPSRVPRWLDGTAARRDDVLQRLADRLDVEMPEPAMLDATTIVDLGPGTEAGVGRFPVPPGAPLAAVVSIVDDDGNEVAGVALPPVDPPVAVFTGWNTRRPVADLPDVLYEYIGSQLPFAEGAASLLDRYGDRTAYESVAREVTARLVGERLLLEGDVDAVIDRALLAFDEALAGEVTG